MDLHPSAEIRVIQIHNQMRLRGIFQRNVAPLGRASLNDGPFRKSDLSAVRPRHTLFGNSCNTVTNRRPIIVYLLGNVTEITLEPTRIGIESDFFNYGSLWSALRLEQPCPHLIGTKGKFAVGHLLSTRLGKFGASHDVREFLQNPLAMRRDMITLTPALTSAASWRVNSTCMAGCKCDSGSSMISVSPDSTTSRRYSTTGASSDTIEEAFFSGNDSLHPFGRIGEMWIVNSFETFDLD